VLEVLDNEDAQGIDWRRRQRQPMASRVCGSNGDISERREKLAGGDDGVDIGNTGSPRLAARAGLIAVLRYCVIAEFKLARPNA
jgi:hypothetical protein